MPKSNWVSRLKKSIASLKGPGHSRAGKKYLVKQKKKKAATAGLSGRTKRELSYYSETDQKAILEALGKR